MANPINNATVTDNYTDANPASIVDIFGGRGGTFNVRNQPVFYKLQYGSLGATYYTDEAACQPGSGSIEPGAIGVIFRNQVAGKAATVDAKIAPPGQPLLTLMSAGLVGATLLTGIVASNGTITAGTGFTVNRTGVGVYVVTFTTPFAAVPVVFPEIIDAFAASGNFYEATLQSVSASGFTVYTGNFSGGLKDLPWEFVAQAVV